MITLISKLTTNEVSLRGLLLIMSHIGMCGPMEYGFRPFWYEMEYSFCTLVSRFGYAFKAGVQMKEVIWPAIMVLMQISRSRFKPTRISMLISHIHVLGRFVNFLVIFRYIWR